MELPAETEELFNAEILEGPNRTLVREIKAIVSDGLRVINQKVEEAVHGAKDIEQKLVAKHRELIALHSKQEKTYESLLEKREKERGRSRERDQLLRRQAQLREAQKKLENRHDEIAKKEKSRESLLRRLSDIRDERFRLRAGVAERLSNELAPSIRVSIEQFGNVDLYQELLMQAMKGSGFKYAQVMDRLVRRIPPHELAAIVQRSDVESLREHLEIDSDRANRIILQLKDTPAVFNIEVVELHDRPTIELKDGPDYKDSNLLSTGQKCTTILPILLLESASPLIVDQPEDNLDNAFIFETIVKSLREVRGRRQLILVTHNPNIPVLGDAEGVFVLTSNGRQADLKAAGSVDDVKDQIEIILEGGKEAFQRRKERYGY